MKNTKNLDFGMLVVGLVVVLMMVLAISGCICKGEGEECSNDLECCAGLECQDVYREGAQYKECHPGQTENMTLQNQT